jgi:DMSO/TMAO reductase YedYZ molybdopterin-dependent catalytic subunit
VSASKINRRQLLRYAAAGLAGSLVWACQRALPTGSPGSTDAQRVILRNLNRARYNVRFIEYTPALDHEQYRLKIEGIVGGPKSLSFQELIEALPVTKQNSRMVCVEGWSFRADWEGFTMQDLLKWLQPEPSARYLHFYSVDNYYEALSIEELQAARVLFAYKMDGDYLSDEHGWPLRLIVPPRYGYKGAKSIVRLAFSAQGGRGYWSTVGAYTVHANIQPGFDYPQDLPGERHQTIEGEQTY